MPAPTKLLLEVRGVKSNNKKWDLKFRQKKTNHKRVIGHIFCVNNKGSLTTSVG